MGLAHFTHSAVFDPMMPPMIPFPRLFIYLAGALQVTGAVGLVILPFFDSAWASRCIVALLVLVISMTPANVYVYLQDVPVASYRLEYNWNGHGVHAAFLIVLIIWLSGLALAYRGRPPLAENVFRQLQHARRPATKISRWSPVMPVQGLDNMLTTMSKGT